MSKGQAYPHERRVQKYAYITLGALVALSVALILRGDGRVLGFELPLAATMGALALGALGAAFGIARRSDLVTGIAAALVALAVIPGGDPRPGVLGYGLGLLFGGALLLLVELVHMTERYERAHRAVETDNVPEEHINRVTDEALKTLYSRVGIAAVLVAAMVGVAYLLASLGPRQWRDAAETTAPLGVAIVALALAGAASLYILARGASFRLRREKIHQETLPDVAE